MEKKNASKPKWKEPEPFYGDKDNLQEFLTSMAMYMRDKGFDGKSEESNIRFVLT